MSFPKLRAEGIFGSGWSLLTQSGQSINGKWEAWRRWKIKSLPWRLHRYIHSYSRICVRSCRSLYAGYNIMPLHHITLHDICTVAKTSTGTILNLDAKWLSFPRSVMMKTALNSSLKQQLRFISNLRSTKTCKYVERSWSDLSPTSEDLQGSLSPL